MNGADWTLRNFRYSSGGSFSVLDQNGQSFDMSQMRLVHVMHGVEFRTAKHTAVRFTMPDNHHDISIEGKVQFSNFTYDPNTMSSSMILNKFDGIIRIVDSKLSNALGLHALHIECRKVPGCGIMTTRGTDIEFMNAEDIKGGKEFYLTVFNGEARFTSVAGQTYTVMKGKYLVVRADGSIEVNDNYMPEPILGPTDSYNMTPMEGRELQ